MAELVWSIDPTIPAVFSNTGLEYPEIVQFIKRKQREGYPIIVVRPKVTFRQVVQRFGFPLVSKKVANMVRRLQNPTPNNEATRRLYLTGINKAGNYNKNSKIPDKWKGLIDAPFKTTEICCDLLKKEPFRRYEKETGRKPFVGVMAAEGGDRAKLTECNAFDAKYPQSRPLLFWLEADVWQYIRSRELDYSDIYKDRYVNGVWVKGESRTGCMFCAFGAHLEKGEGRFQRMYWSHPKLWNYCINKLGMAAPLDFIGVPYLPVDPEAASKDGCRESLQSDMTN